MVVKTDVRLPASVSNKNPMERGKVMGCKHLIVADTCLKPGIKGEIGRAILLAATLFGSIGPASAITAEVAKKCREQAIQAHPPQPAGTIAYREAERADFKECINSAGSSESELPTYRYIVASARGGTVLGSEKPALAPRRHHRRSHDRLALWGRNPAYPLLSAAGYDDRTLAHQSWRLHHHNNHHHLANR